jgi:ABC-type transporter Mla subunit MlaD
VGFLLLVLTLIPAINQLKSLLTDLEKTSSEVRTLTKNINDIREKVENKTEKIDVILDSSKKTVETVSETLSMINKKVLRKSVNIFALIPAIRLGWNFVKKIKGGK